jgi:hypothetical protein
VLLVEEYPFPEQWQPGSAVHLPFEQIDLVDGAFADHLLARSASDTGDDACLVAVSIH